MSDTSDEEPVEIKKKKVTGIRGRRGLKKKASSQTTTEQAPGAKTQTRSHIYSTRVSRCFDHIKANDYDDEFEDAKKDTIERDVEDDFATSLQSKTSAPDTKKLLPDILTLSDDEESSIGGSQKTPKKSEDVEVISPSPPPPPTPPSSGGKAGRRGGRGSRAIRGKKKLLQSVNNLSKDICSARRLLNENPLQLSFTSPDGEMCILDDSDEITVRIQYQGEIRRFAMNSDQPFSIVMEEMADSEDADFYHVMLVHKDKILRPTDTPMSVKLHTADIIMCHIGENLNVSVNNTQETEDSDQIELCVQSRNTRQREIIKIQPHQPLRVLMEEYSRRVGLSMSSLQFSFDGEIVSPAETPENLEMEDGECLDAKTLQEIVID